MHSNDLIAPDVLVEAVVNLTVTDAAPYRQHEKGFLLMLKKVEATCASNGSVVRDMQQGELLAKG